MNMIRKRSQAIKLLTPSRRVVDQTMRPSGAMFGVELVASSMVPSSTTLKRIVLSALLCGTLLTTNGCGIPGLRHAQSGSAMPGSYHWNNGIPFWSSSTTSSSNGLTLPPSSPSDKTQQDEPSLERIDDHLHSKDRINKEGDVSDGDNVDGAKLNAPQESGAFARFIRSASFLSPASQDDEKTKAIDEDIRELESEYSTTGGLTLSAVDDANTDGDTSMGNVIAAPNSPDDGLIDTDIGPSDRNVGVMPFENSAQLPTAVFYSDPYLLSLITDTLSGNQELKILSEEIRIACNESYARSGEYRPFVTLGAGAGFEKPGRHTREGAVEDQLEVAPGQDFPDPLGDFGVGANVSWELDIWNKLHNSQRAAAMRYLGTREGRNYIVTRVVAEVAENYYQLLALDNRLEILQSTIEIQQQSLKVAQAKKAAGRGTELAVQRFQAEVQKNLSERSLIAQEIVEVENRINFLAGRYPQPVERIDAEFVDLHLSTLGAGVPSELLQNRADIREAERQVAAAGLDIKVARARFYPSLSLTAGLGWNAFSTGYLFRTPESLIYGMAGELVGPLINKRAIKADYCSANAAQLQAIYNYQQTVLEAHIEVVNQITKAENYRRSIEVKKRQLEALQASVDAANKLFQNARAEYVEVLLAQRELMEAKIVLVETKQEQLAAIVNAYQALGGGGF
ncbi:Toluene efflux pump outer membrane protein TtgI precursor [Novipirellula aureliae]|uniref:Toluene efflux pump outer membrane protein TtgI n=1 Tax=Novipirellula aureliae TaxID=2527966 RepID=A0A5C6DV37_9BACT|nr:TolC family protein [Novipirellula aureliae]TWU40144.1 Toluene efflux pump outer membrane protein TtgI precursor [Novipirellula aureliae]